MKSPTTSAPSIYRAVLFFLISFLLLNSAYSQLSDADKAKKETRSLLAQLQNSETAKSALIVKKDKLDQKEESINKEAIDILAVQKKHDDNQPPPWDESKPKPQYAKDYDSEKKQIQDKKADISKRLISIQSQKELVQSSLEDLNFKIRSQRGVLRVKSINIKVQGIFNPTNCPQMPGEVATVAEWKSYLDCLFDGAPSNRPDFIDPNKPGGIRVIPNYDPSAQPGKHFYPLVVPPPTSDNTNEKGGSLSDALKSLIYQVRNKIQSALGKLIQ